MPILSLLMQIIIITPSYSTSLKARARSRFPQVGRANAEQINKSVFVVAQ